MITIWIIVIALGVAGAVVAALASWQRRDHKPDLGVVSNQWVAEQRFGQGNDSHR